jgi:flagellar protein FliO/FliZ
MFDTLFGAEVSPALKFFIAFVFVLALIGVTAWLVRRFGAERFGGSSARGRQPRLAVVDAAAVDGRRRLVIIRRDNVEHLLMIGGPTDVVVEQNIVRAMGAPRDKPVEPAVGRALPVSETPTRPSSVAEGTVWPLQPQPENNGRTTPRAIPEEPVQWTWPAHSEPQRPLPRPEPRLDKLDTLTNAADEFSVRPTPPREPHFTRPVTPPPTSRPVPMPPAPAAAPAEKVEEVEKITTAAEPNQNLAELANRMESSLRHAKEPGSAPDAPAPAKDEPVGPPLEQRTPPEPQPTRTEAKPTSSKSLYDSLEEEMASLLGRPPGKT